jgi:hypothetical protein
VLADGFGRHVPALRDAVQGNRQNVALRAQKQRKGGRARDERTVSHRESLIRELHSDPELALQYILAVAEDGNPKVLPAALNTVAAANARNLK